MSTDLHAQLDEAIRARLEYVQQSHGLGIGITLTRALLLSTKRDRLVLERHHPVARDGSPAWTAPAREPICWRCSGLDRGDTIVDSALWPCPDIRDLAVAYGLLDPTAGE